MKQYGADGWIEIAAVAFGSFAMTRSTSLRAGIYSQLAKVLPNKYKKLPLFDEKNVIFFFLFQLKFIMKYCTTVRWNFVSPNPA